MTAPSPTATMRALVREGRSVALRALARPSVAAPDDVLVRVRVAGLCRTDLFVAEGRLPARDPVVLGHEFAGVVRAVGPAVRALAPGDRVTAMPVLPCGACDRCAEGKGASCSAREMLGVHRDGAFAEYVVLPAAVVHRLPGATPFTVGAYAEPVAAALAAAGAGIDPRGRGVIYGDNRIARLTEQVLRAKGFEDLRVFDPRGGERLARDGFDWAVEARATTEAFAEMADAVRPGGTIVVKSRLPEPVAIGLVPLVLKELTLRAVNYGRFDEALALLAEGRVDVRGLLGEAFALEDFERAFAAARDSERAKVFLAMDAPGGERA